MKTILMFVLLALVACSTPRQEIKESDPLKIVYATNEDGNTIVGTQYHMLMYTQVAFPNAQIIPFEENYALMDFNWVVFQFLPYYRELIKELDITYSQQFDCEDFARFFKTELQNLYRKQPQFHQGLSVASIVHKVDARNSHAIIAVFGLQQGRFSCILIEPQNGTLVRVDQFDMSSVWLVLL